MLRARAVVVAAITVMVVAGCGSSSDSGSSTTTTKPAARESREYFAPAPAASKVLDLVKSAGLEAETAESLQHHVHAHLDIFVNGTHELVPGGIGIVITDPQVHHGKNGGFDAYGGISTPCSNPCISPLHTHDVSGTLHTESATAEDNTLGQFFDEWDVKLDGSCVGEYCTPDTPIMVYVNGKTVALGKARDIDLADRTEIAIVIGKSPANIPSMPDFQGAA